LTNPSSVRVKKYLNPPRVPNRSESQNGPSQLWARRVGVRSERFRAARGCASSTRSSATLQSLGATLRVGFEKSCGDQGLPTSARRAFAATDRCGARARGWTTHGTRRHDFGADTTRFSATSGEIRSRHLPFPASAPRFPPLSTRPRRPPRPVPFSRALATLKRLLSPPHGGGLSVSASFAPLRAPHSPSVRVCPANFGFCVASALPPTHSLPRGVRISSLDGCECVRRGAAQRTQLPELLLLLLLLLLRVELLLFVLFPSHATLRR
jgi:hypothetical protein